MNNEFDAQESASTDPLSDRVGIIIVTGEYFLPTPDSNFIKELYENFHPYLIEDDYSDGFLRFRMEGYSKHFRVLEKTEPTPAYRAIFRYVDGVQEFLRFEEKPKAQ
jgi:hypothetical protein